MFVACFLLFAPSTPRLNYDFYMILSDLALFLAIPFGTAVAIFAALTHDFGRPQLDGPRCQQCSYDLTGNESGVCPECGEAI